MSLGVAVHNVSHEFSAPSRSGSGRLRVLHDVTLNAWPGESLALRGPSGSGKTTLLNLIGGLDAPTEGTIFVDGVELASLSAPQRDAWRRSNVTFVFQQSRLINTLTAAENVELGTRMSGVPLLEGRERAAEALALVELAEFANNRPAELSGGQAQRVNIARAIASHAPVVLADEPTSSLDAETAARMIRQLQEIVRSRSITLIVATHDPVVVAGLDRSLQLVDGRLNSL